MKRWRNYTNKTKYLITTVISYVVLLLPIIIFASIKAGELTKNQWVGLTLTGAIVLSLVMLTVMAKMKISGGVWIGVLALVMFVLEHMAGVLAGGLLMVAIGVCADAYITKPIALHYKELWYAERGKTVTYSRKFD